MSLKITLDNIQQALQNEIQLEQEQNSTPNSVGSNSTVPGSTFANTQIPDSHYYTGELSGTHVSHHTELSDRHTADTTPITQRYQHHLQQQQQQHIYYYNPQTSEYRSDTGQHVYPKITDTNQNQPTPNLKNARNVNNRKAKRRSTSPLYKTNEEILNSLKRILEKHEREDRDYEVVQEWRRVAQCVDRILFFVFLIATFFSTIGVLVIAPSTQ